MTKNQIFTLLPVLMVLFLASCMNSTPKNKLSTKKQAEYISEGKAIVTTSSKSLISELNKSLEAGGVQDAIKHCHLKASPLIDSLSNVYNVDISRVSEKYRNADDKPDDLDRTVLLAYQQQLDNGEELQPHLEMTESGVTFYAPILVASPICLLCHGELGKTMAKDNYDLIQSKYPTDLAFGYKLGDLRGVWKVVFNSK